MWEPSTSASRHDDECGVAGPWRRLRRTRPRRADASAMAVMRVRIFLVLRTLSSWALSELIGCRGAGGWPGSGGPRPAWRSRRRSRPRRCRARRWRVLLGAVAAGRGGRRREGPLRMVSRALRAASRARAAVRTSRRCAWRRPVCSRNRTSGPRRRGADDALKPRGRAA